MPKALGVGRWAEAKVRKRDGKQCAVKKEVAEMLQVFASVGSCRMRYHVRQHTVIYRNSARMRLISRTRDSYFRR